MITAAELIKTAADAKCEMVLKSSCQMLFEHTDVESLSEGELSELAQKVRPAFVEAGFKGEAKP